MGIQLVGMFSYWEKNLTTLEKVVFKLNIVIKKSPLNYLP